MTQVYLVRHGETEWNAARRIQGQSDSPLTQHGEAQARLVGQRLASAGITHMIASDLGRTKRTAELLAEYCLREGEITFDSRLRELHMGVLEKRDMDSLTLEEEEWRRRLVNGTHEWRIPEGESMAELCTRMLAALDSCLSLPQDSKVVLVSHGIALSCLVSSLIGVTPGSERRLRLRNCSISLVEYQQSAWLAPGWAVEFAGDVEHLTSPTKARL